MRILVTGGNGFIGKEIIEFLSHNNLKVKSDDLTIKNPIKTIGEHEIEISPYLDVTKIFKIKVIKN